MTFNNKELAELVAQSSLKAHDRMNLIKGYATNMNSEDLRTLFTALMLMTDEQFKEWLKLTLRVSGEL